MNIVARHNKRKARKRHLLLDKVEREIADCEQVVCPVQDVFTPNLYTRITTVPKDTVFTSEIHKTEHPFFLLKGTIRIVNVETGEAAIYIAPCVGVTKPNTRRLCHAIEEVVWATAHVTEETDVVKIGEQILVQRDIIPQYKLNCKKSNNELT